MHVGGFSCPTIRRNNNVSFLIIIAIQIVANAEICMDLNSLIICFIYKLFQSIKKRRKQARKEGRKEKKLFRLLRQMVLLNLNCWKVCQPRAIEVYSSSLGTESLTISKPRFPFNVINRL